MNLIFVMYLEVQKIPTLVVALHHDNITSSYISHVISCISTILK